MPSNSGIIVRSADLSFND